MNTFRQQPWNLVPRLQDELNRLFSNSIPTDNSSATAAWIPPTDVREYADRFEFYVDLPGVDPAQVELTLEGGVLTLSGQRADLNQDARNELQFERAECERGHFHRRYVLPNTVDGERVKANGKNGVLVVTVPKQEKAMSRRIQIAA
jgi:HSP20 family protein